jgi:hypothetical protein
MVTSDSPRRTASIAILLVINRAINRPPLLSSVVMKTTPFCIIGVLTTLRFGVGTIDGAGTDSRFVSPQFEARRSSAVPVLKSSPGGKLSNDQFQLPSPWLMH